MEVSTENKAGPPSFTTVVHKGCMGAHLAILASIQSPIGCTGKIIRLSKPMVIHEKVQRKSRKELSTGIKLRYRNSSHLSPILI